jgi:acetyl-CoA acetyltransferase
MWLAVDELVDRALYAGVLSPQATTVNKVCASGMKAVILGLGRLSRREVDLSLSVGIPPHHSSISIN